MQTDHQAIALLIRMMPLMRREFQIRLDPQRFFADPHYAAKIIGLATDGARSSERLRAIGECLRTYLGQVTAGPIGAARSVPAAPQAPTQAMTQPPPGVAGAPAPAQPPTAPTLAAPRTERPAGYMRGRPDSAGAQPPAGRYLRSLRGRHRQPPGVTRLRRGLRFAARCPCRHLPPAAEAERRLAARPGAMTAPTAALVRWSAGPLVRWSEGPKVRTTLMRNVCVCPRQRRRSLPARRPPDPRTHAPGAWRALGPAPQARASSKVRCSPPSRTGRCGRRAALTQATRSARPRRRSPPTGENAAAERGRFGTACCSPDRQAPGSSQSNSSCGSMN